MHAQNNSWEKLSHPQNRVHSSMISNKWMSNMSRNQLTASIDQPSQTGLNVDLLLKCTRKITNLQKKIFFVQSSNKRRKEQKTISTKHFKNRSKQCS